ncbi:hypothetical protein F4823DRAFT_558063 [Ustulina deusta]|nr:hypothetical protein F4823DRAFT_558063 [Ustulina deusta]
MCSTVIFRYKCGCAERVVFECPFSLTTTSSSNSSKSLRAHARGNCSRRRYRLHQQKLFPAKRTTETTTTASSHRAQPLSLRMKIPILLPPESSSYPQTAKAKEQDTSETTITEIDDICHDCWQRELRPAKQRDDGGASSAPMRDAEDQENLAHTYVLRERPVNEVILLPPSTSLGAVSSAESFPEN